MTTCRGKWQKEGKNITRKHIHEMMKDACNAYLSKRRQRGASEPLCTTSGAARLNTAVGATAAAAARSGVSVANAVA